MPVDFNRRFALGAGLAGFAFAALPSSTASAAPRSSQAPAPDRTAILKMAGSFHVRFDTRETVAFLPDYEPREPSISGGNEVVRIVEDRGDLIRLQHILVVAHEGQDIIVRHWRQDWEYEPSHVLTYAGANTWRRRAIPRHDRPGSWAQTVYNTDDSPRYGAHGVWEHDVGVSRWTGTRELRPLARRDAVRNPPYTHYSCVNRHAITPTGWVHEQDNSKLGVREGRVATYVHEAVINSYDRAADFNIAAADAYLAETQDYWDGVRSLWDARIAAFGGLWLQEAAQTGSASGPPLMDLADKLRIRELSASEAIARAGEIIDGATRRP
jgi:hypothetical protein